MKNMTKEKQNILTIPVKDLTVNHKLQLEDKSWQKIKSIAKGMYVNSKLITYVNGAWSCLLNSDMVQTIQI